MIRDLYKKHGWQAEEKPLRLDDFWKMRKSGANFQDYMSKRRSGDLHRKRGSNLPGRNSQLGGARSNKKRVTIRGSTILGLDPNKKG